MEMKKRLIDVLEFAKRCDRLLENPLHIHPGTSWQRGIEMAVVEAFLTRPVDAVEVVHGRWELTAHEEYSNYRWNVTAECSECHHSKGEVYAGFFPGFPQELARMTVLDCAKSVKLDNYCPNCGAKMDGGDEDEKMR